MSPVSKDWRRNTIQTRSVWLQVLGCTSNTCKIWRSRFPYLACVQMPGLKQETQLPFAFTETFPRDSKVDCLSGVTHSGRKLVSVVQPSPPHHTQRWSNTLQCPVYLGNRTHPVHWVPGIHLNSDPTSEIQNCSYIIDEWTQQITKKLWNVEPKCKTLPLLSFLHTQVHPCMHTQTAKLLRWIGAHTHTL